MISKELMQCYLHYSLFLVCVSGLFKYMAPEAYPWWEQVWDSAQLFRKATIYQVCTSFVNHYFTFRNLF